MTRPGHRSTATVRTEARSVAFSVCVWDGGGGGGVGGAEGGGDALPLGQRGSGWEEKSIVNYHVCDPRGRQWTEPAWQQWWGWDGFFEAAGGLDD